MVRIDYVEEGNTFTLKFEGHAGISDNGQPHYICAAVSSLFYALGAKLSQLNDEGYIDSYICDDKAEVKMLYAESEDSRAIVWQVFDTIICGLDLLAEQYPENVEVFA